MPGRMSGVDATFGVENGVGVAVGGNQIGVGVKVGSGVGSTVGKGGEKVTRHADVDSKNRAKQLVRRRRRFTSGYYSETAHLSCRVELAN